ncbi:MAG TPA: hypothetical protein VEW93_09030 [Acidimicrobiales bacterium]|nr:hypothetical protein [Acidimicrobiales bacterium]
MAAISGLACLMVTAVPSAATTTTFYTQSGTMDLDIDGDPTYEIVIEIGGEDHTCEDPEQTNEFIVDVTETMTTVEEARIGTEKEDGYYASFFDFGGNEYQLDVRIGDPDELGFGTNTGTITGTHPNQQITQHALFEGQIYQTSGCEKGTQICHFAIESTVTGAYNSTTMHVGPLNGSGTPMVDFCDSPFSALASSGVTFTGLTFDDTPPI